MSRFQAAPYTPERVRQVAAGLPADLLAVGVPYTIRRTVTWQEVRAAGRAQEQDNQNDPATFSNPLVLRHYGQPAGSPILVETVVLEEPFAAVAPSDPLDPVAGSDFNAPEVVTDLSGLTLSLSVAGGINAAGLIMPPRTPVDYWTLPAERVLTLNKSATLGTDVPWSAVVRGRLVVVTILVQGREPTGSTGSLQDNTGGYGGGGGTVSP